MDGDTLVSDLETALAQQKADAPNSFLEELMIQFQAYINDFIQKFLDLFPSTRGKSSTIGQELNKAVGYGLLAVILGIVLYLLFVKKTSIKRFFKSLFEQKIPKTRLEKINAFIQVGDWRNASLLLLEDVSLCFALEGMTFTEVAQQASLFEKGRLFTPASEAYARAFHLTENEKTNFTLICKALWQSRPRWFERRYRMKRGIVFGMPLKDFT